MHACSARAGGASSLHRRSSGGAGGGKGGPEGVCSDPSGALAGLGTVRPRGNGCHPTDGTSPRVMPNLGAAPEFGEELGSPATGRAINTTAMTVAAFAHLPTRKRVLMPISTTPVPVKQSSRAVATRTRPKAFRAPSRCGSGVPSAARGAIWHRVLPPGVPTSGGNQRLLRGIVPGGLAARVSGVPRCVRRTDVGTGGRPSPNPHKHWSK